MTTAVLGIDIAKKKFEASLLREGKFRDKSFNNSEEGFAKLAAWLKKQAVERVHACMEATGTYGEELAIFLSSQGHKVSIVNPACIKAYGESKLTRNKTDKSDAHLIALYCESQKPEVWQPPAAEVRQLQALVRHLEALAEMRQQEANRLQSGISEEMVIASLKAHIEYLEREIGKITQQIREHINKHPGLKENKELLTTIPGIGEDTAIKLMAEIVDVRRYSSARQLAAHAGVTPRHHQSGTSVKRASVISKIGNGRIRRALYFPAITAKRFNPIISEFCKRLEQGGKTKMAIIGAAMRKLLHQVFGVLKSGKAFDPNYATKTHSVELTS
jgi:transposase